MFCNEYDKAANAFSIEDDNVIEAVKNEDMLVFAYPFQYYSALPGIVTPAKFEVCLIEAAGSELLLGKISKFT